MKFGNWNLVFELWYPNRLFMKQRFGKYFFLIPLGLFISALSVILFRYVSAPDMVLGALFGAGIGLMLLAFIKRPKASGQVPLK